MKSNNIYLSIVIPAFNEEERILPSLQQVDAFFKTKPYKFEVVVIDDCSTDRTAAIVNNFIHEKNNYKLLINERNVGKGGSVKRGMIEATHGDIRLFMDADLSTPINEIDSFLKEIENYDVIIGSRRVIGAHVAKRQPFFREFAGRIFSVLVRLITLKGYIDTQCGFKMFTARAAEDIFKRQSIDRFGFDVEILYIAKKRGFRVLEKGVTWFDSPLTRVRLFRDSSAMFMDLIKIRQNDNRGDYD